MWEMLQTGYFFLPYISYCFFFVWFDIQILLEGTAWVDVYQINGSLLATGGTEKNVKIFDKRESKIVKTFDDIHKGNNFLFKL